MVAFATLLSIKTCIWNQSKFPRIFDLIQYTGAWRIKYIVLYSQRNIIRELPPKSVLF
jgi:hypothetical protein